MRIILEYDNDTADLAIQVMAAKRAIDGGIIEEGGIFGVRIGDRFYGVKRNKGSVRVYPQEKRA